jgi:myo-inositol-1(or 4)-monophosphatase
MDLRIELAGFAEELARAARAETMARWRGTCAIEDKGSGAYDPVTEADRAAERVMRQLIAERYPGHGITGEECADVPGAGDFVWSLDPIDGTRSFICGLPTWTTLIGFLEAGLPVLGLVDAPCLDETYLGFDGRAFMRRNGEDTEIRTSGCTRLSDARLSTTDPGLFEPAAAQAFDRLRALTPIVRYGHDGSAYARLAAGTIDLVIESGLRPHDYNALIPMITAAGGAIGDWRGGQDFAAGQVIGAATRVLYDEVVGLLSE